MRLSKRQRLFLVGILQDREFYAAMERPEHMGASEAALWIRVQQCQRGEVRVDPASWLGRPLTASDYSANSRCYGQLADKRLIRRLYAFDEGYTSAVRLTEEGERVARELTESRDHGD